MVIGRALSASSSVLGWAIAHEWKVRRNRKEAEVVAQAIDAAMGEGLDPETSDTLEIFSRAESLDWGRPTALATGRCVMPSSSLPLRATCWISQPWRRSPALRQPSSASKPELSPSAVEVATRVGAAAVAVAADKGPTALSPLAKRLLALAIRLARRRNERRTPPGDFRLSSASLSTAFTA